MLVAGCGGAGAPPKPVAERVCDGAHRAAVALLDIPVSARVIDPAPADLECLLTGRRVRVTIVSQASSRAYTEFDTETSHQDQVYGPGVHEPSEIPSVVSVPGSVAVWIRAQKLLVATNATPTTGGSYVTVGVTGRAARRSIALSLARAVARATFAAHPDSS